MTSRSWQATDRSNADVIMRTAVLMLAVVMMTNCDRFGNRTDLPALHQALFDEIQPVKLSNCEFERIGDPHDGGYLACKNLVPRSQAVYSYGIAGTDEWGCALSARLALPVHEYDCFNPSRPTCIAGANPMFHDECVGPRQITDQGRLFDTVENHIAKNGDAGKRIIMKMDVEGAEWPSFLQMPDAVLNQIDQLTVEFHDVNDPAFLDVIRKLKRTFYVANLHYNNWECRVDAAPLPARVFELLFVNKSIGILDAGSTPVFPNPLDAANNPNLPDCQKLASESRPQ
jgi:hypothetical protein